MKKLYRSKTDKKIAGICGGLGDYFDIDPVIFRVLFIASILFGGIGILLYIALWICAPYQVDDRQGVDKMPSHPVKRG